MLKRLKICLCTIATHSLVFVAYHSLQAQSGPPPLNFAQEPSTGQEPHESDWRMTILPRVVEPEDAASKALLNARGAYFDPEPVAPGIAQLLGDSPAQKELPTEKSGAVVVGQFTRPLAHLSPSGRSVYMQIVVKPLEVLKTDDHKAPHALTLPILIEGGAVHDPSGNIVRSPVAQDYLWVTPGHTYVFFLIRNKTADFYTILKTWDVTTGIAVPIAHEDRSSGDHVSENAGVRLPAFIEKLKKKIALEKTAK